MRKEEAINHYGSQSALARALGIAQASVAGWSDYPPDARQLQIQKLTRGKLKAEPGCLDRLLNPTPKAKAA